MGNINRMVDIVVLLILTGLSVSDIRNKKSFQKSSDVVGNIDSLLENSGFLSDQSVPGKDGTDECRESCWNRSGSAVPSCQ